MKQLGVAPLNSVNQDQTWRPLVRIGTRAGRENVVNSCDVWTGHWTSHHDRDINVVNSCDVWTGRWTSHHDRDINVVNSCDSGLVTGLHIMTVT